MRDYTEAKNSLCVDLFFPWEAPCIVSFEHCDYFRYIFLRGLLVALLLSRSSLWVFDDTVYRENRAYLIALIYVD